MIYIFLSCVGFLFLFFILGIIQYLRRENKKADEQYRLVSLGLFLVVLISDLSFLSGVKEEYKFLVQFLILSFSSYLFALSYKSGPNKWLFYTFILFSVLFFCMAILFSS